MPKYLPPPHKFRPKTLDSTDTVDFTHFRRTVNRYCVPRDEKTYLTISEKQWYRSAFASAHVWSVALLVAVYKVKLSHLANPNFQEFGWSKKLCRLCCVFPVRIPRRQVFRGICPLSKTGKSWLTLYLTASSIDNLSKQFGPRSGLTNVGPDLDPNSLPLWRYYWIKKRFEKVESEGKKSADI